MSVEAKDRSIAAMPDAMDAEEQGAPAGARPETSGQAGSEEIPGAVTSAYRGNPRRVAERLNQLRSTEIVSYLQYKQHAYMAVSLVGPGVKAEFLEHADEEIHHADMLANRIQQLGGTPIYDLCEIAQKAAEQKVRAESGQTVREMVMEDLEVERRQVVAYTELIREVGDADPVTRRMLEDILIATEHHASELRDMLMTKA